jgi:hypothetical protein
MMPGQLAHKSCTQSREHTEYTIYESAPLAPVSPSPYSALTKLAQSDRDVRAGWLQFNGRTTRGPPASNVGQVAD